MTIKITIAICLVFALTGCGQKTSPPDASTENTSTTIQAPPPVTTSPSPQIEPKLEPPPSESAEALEVETLFDVAALYHSINPERPVQYEALIRRLNLPYSRDPNEAEKIKEDAIRKIDNELKSLPVSRLRFMELGSQTTPIYNKELGGMPVEVPEILYISDSTYKFEVVNKKRFTFIPLATPEDVEKADAMGFNKRKNPFVNMQIKFKVLERKASGLAAGSENKIYVELKSIEFLTQKDIPIFMFEGL